MDKAYFNRVIDHFEADMYETTREAFNKRSSVGRKGGRPYSYSPREIGEQMVIYFRNCADNNQPIIITGLCLNLGMSRRGFLNLGKSPKQEFVHIIQKGRQMVELYWEMQSHLMPNPRWPIFILKNMGWREQGWPCTPAGGVSTELGAP